MIVATLHARRFFRRTGLGESFTAERILFARPVRTGKYYAWITAEKTNSRAREKHVCVTKSVVISVLFKIKNKFYLQNESVSIRLKRNRRWTVVQHNTYVFVRLYFWTCTTSLKTHEPPLATTSTSCDGGTSVIRNAKHIFLYALQIGLIFIRSKVLSGRFR